MFNLDDQFLADIGLADMPEDQKGPFKQHIYNELELRVGSRLSEGMSEEQLEEFEAIIDHKDEVITNWLATYAPEYRQDTLYQRIQEGLNGAPEPEVRAEYAATKWLEVNRPDYRDVVAQTLEELKQEIMGNKDVLLGNSNNAPTA